ncbi:uncharacterized protein BP5553_08711 [Venustampulla echinocandica]|uniref:DUF7924 domain-containing protein n=1 Tax=Venustampulla echinocandica TaxID=2656787 RepID=A0A370TF04_9HELO|nr:uncharacterized protein BP5553_08711 [Venustampulla echinocandica]RDL33272.1 hypothetical protein BP5553_08711 [Venustampulla echinocandica]
MPGASLIESRSPRRIPPKRSFADFHELDHSSRPGTTKRVRIETEEAEEEAEVCLSPYTSQRLMEKIVQTVQLQPKPLPLKRPYASFLEVSLDPLSSSPSPKTYRPESVDSFVTQWVESASGSYRERHCRSDTLLDHSDGDPIPRRLTKSAPNMDYRRDADGFALPPTPVSTRLQSHRADAEDDSQASWYGPLVAPSDISGASTSSSRKSLVEDPSYRDMNLTANHIYIRPSYEQLPEHITSLVDQVRRNRDSPGPSLKQVLQDTRLAELEMGTAESKVESDRLPMAKHAVPDFGSKLKVSTPVPDLLYGYSRTGAFHQQQAQFPSMGNEMVASSNGLVYPFFVIEFNADGPSGSGSLWVATNQCLGGSASCINIAERLNRQLRQYKNKTVQPIESTAFSIAMNGTEARLYVSWKHDELKYYTRKVDSFLLQKPKDYIEFRKYVRNIIDWGKDKRLNEIRDSLNSLLEESRRTASQLARSRPAPSSDDSARSNSHKRKSSSSRGRNSKTKTIQEYPNGGANTLSSACFQENDQDDSSVQIPAANNVYAPPSTGFQDLNQV